MAEIFDETKGINDSCWINKELVENALFEKIITLYLDWNALLHRMN